MRTKSMGIASMKRHIGLKGDLKLAYPWWTLDGTLIPNAAYQAIGAESEEASWINLANPGTGNLLYRTGGQAYKAPWSNLSGWLYDGVQRRNLYMPGIYGGRQRSIMIRYANLVGTSFVGIFGANGGTYGTTPAYGFGAWATGKIVVDNGSLWGSNGETTSTFSFVPDGGTICIAGPNLFIDGAHKQAIAASPDFVLEKDLYIGTMNDGVAQIGLGTSWNCLAAYVYYGVLSDSQVGRLHTLMMGLPFVNDEIFFHTTSSNIYVSGT